MATESDDSVRMLARLALFIALSYALMNPCVSTAQTEDDDIYFIELFEIEASEEQRDILYDIDVKYWELLQPLEKQLRKLQLRVSTLKQNEMVELYARLSPEQINSINTQRFTETREEVARSTPFLPMFAKYSAGLAKTGRVELLEGFPRRAQGDTDSITANSSSIQIHGFNFYPKPLQDTGTSVEIFRETATNHQFFSPTHPGGKFCGGFHPDIALRYTVDGVQHHVLICLTCNELWLVREGDKSVTKFDFTTNAREVFKQTAASVFVNHVLTVP